MDNMVGKWLDNRYELLEVIGSGGMAVVYKAMCHRLNRLVAVKILKSELAEDAEFRRRFRDESQAVAMLSHPNIVSVYDVSRGEIEYIVMELIDGITLKQYMQRRGQLNWREALHFITQIMKGLSHAHSRGIIHRDIKPQNIMVLRDGSVKVADFGIARLESATQNTMTQEAIGSVHYISPEQAKGDRTDARSDIYSAGVVLYEMLTNRLPFEGETPVSVALQHLSSVPLSPREINPEVPEALEKICVKAMTADIDKRYASADEMLADLEEFRKNPEVDLGFTISDLRTKETDEPTQPISVISGGAVRRSADIEEDDEPHQGLIPRPVIIAGIVAVCAVLLFAIWHVVLGSFAREPAQTEFEVPNLVGMTIEQAMRDSRVAGIFEIEQIGQRADSNYAAGQIIEQTPSSGKTVKENRLISVFLSTGAHTETMPALIGKEYRSATIQLRQLGLDLNIEEPIEHYSDSYTAGRIIETIPVEGATLNAGDSITMVVSLGAKPKPVAVINFVGGSIDMVRQQVESLKLTFGSVDPRYDDSVPEGHVIEQSIAPTSQVEEGTIINFVVSLGPEPSQPEPAPVDEPPVIDPEPAPEPGGETPEPTEGTPPGGEGGETPSEPITEPGTEGEP